MPLINRLSKANKRKTKNTFPGLNFTCADLYIDFKGEGCSR